MKVSILFLLSILAVSCSKPTARRPINPKPSTTINGLVKENKILNQIENKKIAYLIAKDSTHQYYESHKGFWYTYVHQIKENTVTPQKGDIVTFEYNIKNLKGTFIYTKEELGVKTYSVDKEDFITALQSGIKLMKRGETITFVVPSYNAFGISGDGDRIGINQSIISTVTLIDIKSIKKNENN